MAIFMASTKSISRAKGQSIVASASYRAGAILEDERYGKTHNYSKRDGVVSADIILPSALKASSVHIDRGELWNMAERSEKRKDARVGREWLVNLPYELSAEDRKALAHRFSQELADRYNVIADCAIHKPSEYEVNKRGADPRNHHAHILLTTRQAQLGKDNTIILTDKSIAELSDRKRRELGLVRMSEEIKEIRQLWERVANEKLAEHGLNLIDCRSYKDVGIDIEPQLKMGPVATKMEREKYERELRHAQKDPEYQIDTTPVTHLGSINQIINERNELVFGKELAENQRINERVDQIIFESRKLNEREQSNDRLREAIDRATRYTQITVKNTANLNKLAEYAVTYTTFLDKSLENAVSNSVRFDEILNKNQRRLKKTAQRTADINRIIDSSKQQAASAEQAIAGKAMQSPSPFDEQYRASVNRREQASADLAKQQRRLDRDTRRNKYEDERRAKAAELVKHRIAAKLLHRNSDGNRLRWERYEDISDYPHKYDRRQSEILNKFAERLGINHLEYHSEKLEALKAMIDGKFIEQHQDILALLKDPKQEREQYNKRLTAWIEFKAHIDSERDKFNESIIEKLNGSAGEVGRMTRDIISSFSYIKGLDSFISDRSQTLEAREQAQDHRAKTLDKTCQQLKHAYFDVNKLPSGQRKSYLNALNTSVETFKQVYGTELLESQQKAIEEGLRSFNRELQRSQTYSPGFSL